MRRFIFVIGIHKKEGYTLNAGGTAGAFTAERAVEHKESRPGELRWNILVRRDFFIHVN